MIDYSEAIAIILVASIFTFITRVIPFALFGGKKQMPIMVKKIATKLPPAIIAILVIYCIKDIGIGDINKMLATFISITVVVLLHLWQREMLLSIGGGTILYMCLLHLL